MQVPRKFTFTACCQNHRLIPQEHAAKNKTTKASVQFLWCYQYVAGETSKSRVSIQTSERFTLWSFPCRVCNLVIGTCDAFTYIALNQRGNVLRITKSISLQWCQKISYLITLWSPVASFSSYSSQLRHQEAGKMEIAVWWSEYCTERINTKSSWCQDRK